MNKINIPILLNIISLYIIWGSTYLFIKMSIDSMPPYLMLSIRFLIASALIFFWYLVVLKKKMPKSFQIYKTEFVAGNLLLVGGLGSITFAENWVSSGIAAIAIATVPVFLSLFDFLINKKPVESIVFLVIGFVGVVVLNIGEVYFYSYTSIFFCLIAPVSWAIGSIFYRRMKNTIMETTDSIVSSALQMFFAAISFIVFHFLFESDKPVNIDINAVVTLSYLIVFGSIIAFSSYLYLCSSNISTSLLGSYAYVNPIVAVILGFIFQGEELTVWGWVATFLITISVIYLVKPGSSNKQKSSDIDSIDSVDTESAG
jgi:drug/metabolite transporter (DMT)-like permease